MKLKIGVVMRIVLWFIRECLLYWITNDGDENSIMCYF